MEWDRVEQRPYDAFYTIKVDQSPRYHHSLRYGTAKMLLQNRSPTTLCNSLICHIEFPSNSFIPFELADFPRNNAFNLLGFRYHTWRWLERHAFQVCTPERPGRLSPSQRTIRKN